MNCHPSVDRAMRVAKQRRADGGGVKDYLEERQGHHENWQNRNRNAAAINALGGAAMLIPPNISAALKIPAAIANAGMAASNMYDVYKHGEMADRISGAMGSWRKTGLPDRPEGRADGGAVDDEPMGVMDYLGSGAALADLYTGGMLSTAAGLVPGNSIENARAARDRALERVPRDWKSVATETVGPSAMLFGFGRRKVPSIDPVWRDKHLSEIDKLTGELSKMGAALPDEVVTLSVARDRVPAEDLPGILEKLKRLRETSYARNTENFGRELRDNVTRLGNAPDAIAARPTASEVAAGEGLSSRFSMRDRPLSREGGGPMVSQYRDGQPTGYVRAAADPEIAGARANSLRDSMNSMERQIGADRDRRMAAQRTEKVMDPENVRKSYVSAKVDGLLLGDRAALAQFVDKPMRVLNRLKTEAGLNPLEVIDEMERRGFDLSFVRRHLMQQNVGKPYEEGGKEVFKRIQESPILYRKRDLTREMDPPADYEYRAPRGPLRSGQLDD